MRQHHGQLEQLGIDVCVVTFDAEMMARNYVRQTGLPWPLLLDTQREFYEKYQMGRGSWWSIYGPASIWHYLKLIGAGRRVERPGSDFRQFGGDILIDPGGIVRMHYVSTSPHDRPTVRDILDSVRPT